MKFNQFTNLMFNNIPILPTRESIVNDVTDLRKLLSEVSTVRIDQMLVGDPSITFDVILNIWNMIKVPHYGDSYANYRRRKTTQTSYPKSLKYLLQKLSERETVTIETVNNLIDNNVSYEMFRIVLKRIKMSTDEKLDMITKITQREYQGTDVKIVTSYQALLCKHPIQRNQLMLWLLDHSDELGMITSAKLLYDMADSESRFEYFKICCGIDSSISNSSLLEHMLTRSTSDELPGARDILLDHETQWSHHVYSVLLRGYTQSI
jgi:hypothetical protein